MGWPRGSYGGTGKISRVVDVNHDDMIGRFATAYVDLLHVFILEINTTKDFKRKIEKQQDLDKVIHYMYKVSEIVRDLNQWFTAFGADDDADKNS